MNEQEKEIKNLLSIPDDVEIEALFPIGYEFSKPKTKKSPIELDRILYFNKYGKKKSFPRLALHAQSIGFHHPQTKKYLEFSLRPPKEFLTKVGI